MSIVTSVAGGGGGGGGSGTVGGALGATDNALLRADGAGGSTAQGSLIVVDDTGHTTLPDIAEIRWSDILIRRLAGPFLQVMDLAGTTYRSIKGRTFQGHNGTTLKVEVDPASRTGFAMSSDARVSWDSSTTLGSGSIDTQVSRSAAGVVSIDTTAAGNGLGRLKVGGGRLVGLTSSAGAASTIEYPSDGDWGLHKNTASGVTSLARNDGGVIKSAALV